MAGVMVIDGFHPAVAAWFRRSFDAPTEVQAKAWPEIKGRGNTLIAAPTGSGKTLAAFLSIIDDLVRQGLGSGLPEGTQVVYVSPLKALSNDIERNLQAPLRGIREALESSGLPDVDLRVLVRTGDTPSSARTAMIKHPPHILVTTPESLYLLLTSENGRGMLSTVHTVILDEIHAMVGDKRGSHLSLSIERLADLVDRKLVRVGLSATQNPIDTVARFLVGDRDAPAADDLDCTVIDTGHRREMDLAIEVPRSPLGAVMANEVWDELYGRLEALILSHRTTLIFVSTRRLAERMAHNLTEKLGPEYVTAHHGSMSREQRLDAEQRLKNGALRALVATASLELGIDIGSVDLVCHMGAPKSIAALLQRVGRSGHTIHGVPKGRLFPLSRDELVECAAVFDAVRHGELDRIVMPEKPLDILAQQIVAEVASGERREKELYDLFRRAYPYRNLTRREFDDIVKMLAEGFTSRNGRRQAYIHRDVVNGRLRGRRGARLTALVAGGAIPDHFDYDVILEPMNTFLGTVNEDFAIESMAGDVFQLGNNSWRILRVERDKVRVEDARGLAPSMPFWLGEAPGRTAELSDAVSRVREEISGRVGDLKDLGKSSEGDKRPDEPWKTDALAWLVTDIGMPESAADQIVTYLAAAKAALGAMPSKRTMVMERFFDEVGDMHLVIHSPLGSRVNRAWGLALRKRFCRQFNFELQAAATEDSILLSLGVTHSFPLDDVFHYLSPETVRDVLIQALLDSPMFNVRWRWNASRALAVLRNRAGKKVPPAIQRMQSEDLIALVFPDQLACRENVGGDREIPEHPLVQQTIGDCLHDAMDIERLEGLLRDIQSNRIELVALDMREPSPLSEGVIKARPYAFLDDAPLEERRANAVQNRRWLDPAEAADLGKLDAAAIEAVRSEAWPQVRDADELHDALVLCGFLTREEGEHGDGACGWTECFEELVDQKRASLLRRAGGRDFWVAVERSLQMQGIVPGAAFVPELRIPERVVEEMPSGADAMTEIVRARLEALGPVRAIDLADSMGVSEATVEGALAALENEGFVLRGQFTPNTGDVEWCERRLLARIHRYTIRRLRKEIEPVSSADFMRFLFTWHRLNDIDRPEGADALRQVLKQLEGFEAPAASWEGDLLPARMREYDYTWLDALCLSGVVVWGRRRPQANGLSGKKSPTPIKSTPISFIERSNHELWKTNGDASDDPSVEPSIPARGVLALLEAQGALFFDEIVGRSGLLKSQVEDAIAELVALGALTADSYTGLRALLVQSKYRVQKSRRRKHISFTMDVAGRWSLLKTNGGPDRETEPETLDQVARILLRRYGVVFRKLADRETLAPPWRHLVRVYRRLEARGEVRGGRFVEGVWGEQFALPEAVTLLRSTRREAKGGMLTSISAADPLNLTGIITPGRRVASLFSNRVLYRDGVPIAVKEGKEIQFLTQVAEADRWRMENALIRRSISPKLRAYLGKGVE